MLAFNNDYSHGAHPAVLQALVDTNMEPQPGYGTDAHTERAKQLIREACQAPDADVFFLVGGTQANATVIDMLLAPYEGVVAAETGHVACHEAGAIEFGGHKVLTIPGYEGKMRWRPMSATLPCPSWRSCVTCSTSAAPSAARFAARPWCFAACALRRIPFRALSSTARCWPRVA